MEPNKTAGKVIVIFSVLVSAAIGGILGVFLTSNLWHALLVAFFIGFGTYIVFLVISLVSFYVALIWVGDITHDK